MTRTLQALLALVVGALLPLTAPGEAKAATPTYWAGVIGITTTYAGQAFPYRITGKTGPVVPPRGYTMKLTTRSCTGFASGTSVVPTRTFVVTSEGAWDNTAGLSVIVLTSNAEGYIVRPHAVYQWSIEVFDTTGALVATYAGAYDFTGQNGFVGRACPTTQAELCAPFEVSVPITCEPTLFGIPNTPGGGTGGNNGGGGDTGGNPDDPNDPDTPVVTPHPDPSTNFVKAWSKKTGTTIPRIGKTLKVTATTLTPKAPTYRAKVTYAWKVAGRVVNRTRTLRLAKAWKGKPVVMVVTVKAPGVKTRTRTLPYGKVRK